MSNISDKISPETRELLNEVAELVRLYIPDQYKPNRCLYCKDIIYKFSFYCDDICREISQMAKRESKKMKTKPCNDCGVELKPFVHKSGKTVGLSTGRYPKRCKECNYNNMFKKRGKYGIHNK